MKNKLMKMILTGAVLVTSVVPAFAATVETNPTGEQSTTVTYDSTKEPSFAGDSFYSVSIPKSIDMGNQKTANYEVGVAGSIKTNEHVTITPVSEFTMTKTGGSETVTATVTQADTSWNSTELDGTVTKETTSGDTISYKINEYTKKSGKISAPDLTDGQWSGTLTFHIGRTVD